VRPHCLICQGKVRRSFRRGISTRCPYAYRLKRFRWVWHLVWLRGFGTTIIRCTLGDVVVWQHPNFTWYGDLKKMKKKKQVGQPSDAMHLAAMESTILSKHHSLVAHCAVTKYDDGDTRQPGWWTLKTMGSAWVVEVKDPDTCMRLVVVQQTADEALTLASLLLESEEAPWEPDPWLTAAKAKKKQK